MKISKTGYKRNSKDKNEKSLLIPTNSITMQDVDFPVLGIDNLGNKKFMQPGNDYIFPGDFVTEFPIKQMGGNISYNSKLVSKDIAFQNWYSKNTLEGKKGIPYNDKLDYDYYSFYKNNGNGDIKNHFPDTYKRPNHETFSNESIYSIPENKGGHWDEKDFIKKLGGQMKKPNNKGFDSLPNNVQEFILAHMQQGGQPVMQSGSFNKLSPTDIRQAWESNPAFRGKPFRTELDSTNIESGKQYYNYSFFPTDIPQAKINIPDTSTPQSMVQIEDPMKQEGYNGMMKPIVQKFNMGGGLNKFVKNFDKSSAPQGESLDDYLKKNNIEFVEYLASNTRSALLKDEVNTFQKVKNFFQMGGPKGYDSNGTNGFDPDQYWVNNQNVTTGINPEQSGFKSSDLLGTPQGTPIQTTGYAGNYTGTTPIFQDSNTVPKYVSDFKATNDPGAKQVVPASKGKGAGAAGIMSGMSGMGSALSALPGMVDPSSFIDAFKDSIGYQEKLRKDKWLDDQMRIENQVPKSYGSRGDYDINQGNFRPNQKTPVSYKNGGGYNLDKLPKAQWGAIIQMALGSIKETQQVNQQFFAEQQAKKQAENQANMQSLAAAGNFSSQNLPQQQSFPSQQAMYEKGGSTRKYSQGKTYQLDDHSEIYNLIKQGYEIEFVD